jgi:putative redox protein
MTYEITANYRQGVEFRAGARGHEIVCDQPAGNGGADQGLTPPELLLASLATCAGYYAVEYLRTRNLNADRLNVRASAEKSTTRPVRLEKFRITVDAPFVSEDHYQGLRRAVEVCLIEKTLAAPSAIEVELSLAASCMNV